MTSRKCAHEACNCEIGRTGSNYCSVYCEQGAKGIPDEMGRTGCRCGHAGCGATDEFAEDDMEQHV